MDNINEMALAIRQCAIDHGWEATARTFGDWTALLHTEASEAFEEYRDGRQLGEIYHREDGKPEGVLVELADVVIRALHTMQYIADNETVTVDDLPVVPPSISDIIFEKMQFNQNRPYRHGGKIA